MRNNEKNIYILHKNSIAKIAKLEFYQAKEKGIFNKKNNLDGISYQVWHGFRVIGFAWKSYRYIQIL